MNNISPINHNIKNEIQFKGIIPQNAMRRTIASDIASMLSQDRTEMLEFTKFMSNKKFYFLNNLAEKYNRLNFSLPYKQKEDIKLVDKIFKTISKPSAQHLKLIIKHPGNFEALAQTFFKIGNSKKNAKFVNNIIENMNLQEKNSPQNIIPDLLNSKYNKKFVNNFNKYKPYLILYKNDPNVVKNLEHLIKNKKYSKSKYKLILQFENLKSQYSFANTPFFNKDIYAIHANPRRMTLLEDISLKHYISDEMFRNGNDKDIANIYKTTNKTNYKLRSTIINSFALSNSSLLTKTTDTKDIENLKNLFNILDNNKYARHFINALIKNSKDTQHYHRIANIVNVLQNIPPEELNSYKKNAIYIMNTTNPKEYIAKMQKELKNPLLRLEEDDNVVVRNINKLYLKFENSINNLKYKIYSKNNPQQNTELLAPKVINESKKADISKTFNQDKPQIETIANTKVENAVKKENSQIQSYSLSIRPLKGDTNSVQIDPKRLFMLQINQADNFKKLKNIYSKTVKLFKKKETENNILDITSNKLGKKTFDKQKDLYKSNATKIRLSLLPEMFASIIETRKVDKAIGKKHNISANKDVLNLYLLTNGSNKKLINYMLKKRNVDGTRMFEVKDIINEITQAEKKIARTQKENPNYKANDARKYYNHLYEAKIEQYGKLKRQKRVNTQV